ncbi:EpsG family protein [Vibrio splendidus]|uniref:EpsG family protein n=1 Tax=Vibrio splendidus TaxID=29497 RepID=UPI002410CBFD|nr:EpsG family protein [Vibrio splendidus]
MCSFVDCFSRINKKPFLYTIAIMLIMISGFRWMTGLDWHPYVRIFNNSNDFDYVLSGPYEKGFLLFNYVINKIFGNYTAMLLITALIVILLKCKVFIKLTPFPLLALFINASFVGADLFTNRQGIAVAFTIFSFIYIYEKKPLKFFITCSIAFIFHYSAVVFYPAYYIAHLNLTLRRQFFLLFVSFVGYLLFKELSILKSVGVFIGGAIGDKISFNQQLELSEISMVTFSLRVMKKVVFLLFFAYFFKKYSCYKYKISYNLFFSSVCMFIVCQSLPGSFIRLTMYYSYYEVLLLTFIIFFLKPNYRALYLLFVGFYCLSKFIYGFQTDYEVLIPYESIFNEEHKIIEYQRFG